MRLFAWSIIQRFEFAGMRIVFLKDFKFGRHVSSHRFKHGVGMLFADRQTECHVVLDDIGKVAITDLDSFGQQMV